VGNAGGSKGTNGFSPTHWAAQLPYQNFFNAFRIFVPLRISIMQK
jgi:hypothetical protein